MIFLKYFLDEKLISKSWVMEIFFEKFRDENFWKIFNWNPTFFDFDFRKVSIGIQLFSIFRFYQEFSKLIFRWRNIFYFRFFLSDLDIRETFIFTTGFFLPAGKVSGIFFTIVMNYSLHRARDSWGWPCGRASDDQWRTTTLAGSRAKVWSSEDAWSWCGSNVVESCKTYVCIWPVRE